MIPLIPPFALFHFHSPIFFRSHSFFYFIFYYNSFSLLSFLNFFFGFLLSFFLQFLLSILFRSFFVFFYLVCVLSFSLFSRIIFYFSSTFLPFSLCLFGCCSLSCESGDGHQGQMLAVGLQDGRWNFQTVISKLRSQTISIHLPHNIVWQWHDFISALKKISDPTLKKNQLCLCLPPPLPPPRVWY